MKAFPPGEAVTVERWLEADREWAKLAAPATQPEKVLDYAGGWRTFPNFRRPGVTINRFGLRGQDCLRTVTLGMKRVLCIGDSCVFGVAPDDAPWPAQLQVLLDRQAPLKYQVLNAGVNGQSARHVALRLPYLLRLLKPDLVLISVLANDLWATDPGEATDLSRWIPPRYVASLELAVDLCRSAKARPVLVTPPGMVPTCGRLTGWMLLVYHQAGFLGAHKQPGKMRLLYDRYNQAIRDVAARTAAACIDTAAEFDTRLDDQRDRLFFDTCHMLNAGNTEMAKIIAQGFAAQGL